MSKSTIVCFGEVLWDMLPTGKLAGGAPMNVGFVMSDFGQRTTDIRHVKVPPQYMSDFRHPKSDIESLLFLKPYSFFY